MLVGEAWLRFRGCLGEQGERETLRERGEGEKGETDSSDEWQQLEIQRAKRVF